MELISGHERNALLGGIQRDAFHLELRDTYHVDQEEDPYTAWLRGEPDDQAWMAPWLAMIRRLSRSGRAVRRVRVVTEPVSDYIRFEYEGTPDNLAAGEDIRWLPRHDVPEALAMPVGGRDWWLLDDATLAVGHFDVDGRVLGSEIVTDAATVAECVRVRELLWSVAIPHDAYTPR
ncbi:hypothetical protein CLV63_111184 [Murinocardiopsis flavida]|uniref:DUF6879 domain-containing protein n=1 Tax=Murinocardiopsis flavida TaxID=645275 RepID=A0A2P8DHD1_9ACTN|nr:DUF6879 family protein [Murinocardiopsis flavida]PSK96589.1 hypothetical protein CLV63_111184 [Murinocardiopsis flavida]